MLTEDFTKLLRKFESSKIFEGGGLSLFDSFNESINKLEMSFNCSCEAQFVLYMFMFKVSKLLENLISKHEELTLASLLSAFSRAIAEERLKWSPEEEKREQVRREWYLEHNYNLSQEFDTAGFPPSLLNQWYTVICKRSEDCRSLWLIISAKVVKQYVQRYYYCVQQLELWLEWRRRNVVRIRENWQKSKKSQPSHPSSSPLTQVQKPKIECNELELTHEKREEEQEQEQHHYEQKFNNYNEEKEKCTINIAESELMNAVLQEHLFLEKLNINVSELSKLHAEDKERERRSWCLSKINKSETTITVRNNAKTNSKLDKEHENEKDNANVIDADNTISTSRVDVAARSQRLENTYSEVSSECELESARSEHDGRENIFDDASQIHIIQNVMERWRTADHNTTLLSINYFFTLIDAKESSGNVSEIVEAFVHFTCSVLEYNPLPVGLADEYKNSQKEQLLQFAEHWATSKLYRTLLKRDTNAKEKKSINSAITLNLKEHIEADQERHNIADNNITNIINAISYNDSNISSSSISSSSSSDDFDSSSDEFDIFATQMDVNERNESSNQNMYYSMQRSEITYNQNNNNYSQVENNSYQLLTEMRKNEYEKRESTNAQSQKWRQICSDPFTTPVYSELIDLVNKTDIQKIDSKTLNYESTLALAWEFMNERETRKTKLELMITELEPLMTLEHILPCDWPSDRTEFMKGDIHLSSHLSSDEQKFISECLEIHLREIDCSLYKEVQEWMCKEQSTNLSEEEIYQQKLSNWRRLIEEQSVFNLRCEDRQASIITLASLYGGVLTLELINPQQISGNPAFGIQCDTCCVGKVKASFQAVLENGVRSEIMIMPQFLGFDMCIACAYYYYKSSCVRLLRALHPSLPERYPFIHGLNCEMVIWHMEVELCEQESHESEEHEEQSSWLLQIEKDKSSNVTGNSHKTSDNLDKELSLLETNRSSSIKRESNTLFSEQLCHSRSKIREEGHANSGDDDDNVEKDENNAECTSSKGSDTHRMCTLKVKMCVGVSPINAQPVAWHIPTYKLEKLKQVLECNNTEDHEIECSANADDYSKKDDESVNVNAQESLEQSSDEATLEPCGCENDRRRSNNYFIKINKRLLSYLPVPPLEWAAHCTVTRSTMIKNDEEELIQEEEELEKESELSCMKEEKEKEAKHADQNIIFENSETVTVDNAKQLLFNNIKESACTQGKDVNDKSKKKSTKISKKPLFSEDDCCSICLLPLAGPTPTLQTRCKHWFHAKCIIEVYNRRLHRKEIDNEILSNTSSLTSSLSSSHEMINTEAASDSSDDINFSTSDSSDDWLNEDDADETRADRRRRGNATARRTEQRRHRTVVASGEGCPVCRCDDYMPHDINQVDAVIRKNVYDVTLSIELPQSSLISEKRHMHRELNKFVMCPPQTVAVGTLLSEDALFHNPTNMSSCELREVQLGYLSSSEVVPSHEKIN